MGRVAKKPAKVPGARLDRAESARLKKLLAQERALWRKGYRLIAGVDEAGMGPWAGPVVAAAVVLPRDFRPPGIDDSKALNEPLRERLAVEIRAAAVAWGLGVAEVDEIDRLNIYRAGLVAMRRAVEALSVSPDFVLVDARTIPAIAAPQKGLIRGDALSLTIAAASIVAKTARDAMMRDLDRQYPGYGFARHKGYGTPEHKERLSRLGPCPIHRRSFAPVRDVLGDLPRQEALPLRVGA